MPGLQRELIFRFGLKSVRFADATGKDEKSVAVLNSFTSAYHLHVLKRFAWLDNFWYNLSTNKIYLLLRYVYDPPSVYIYKYQINRITFNVNNNNGKNIMYRLFRAWVVSYLGTFLLKYFIFANQKNLFAYHLRAFTVAAIGWEPLERCAIETLYGQRKG